MESVSSSSSIQFIDEAGVRGYLHAPTGPLTDGLVISHGAGANCQSPLLIALANEFCQSGIAVLRIDLPFRQLRPHGPPIRTAERDQEGIQRAIEFLRKRVSGRVFAGGHSYGGRQTTMLAASRPELVDGLLLLSYPLHPPNKPDQLRTAHFPELRTPSLFVQGSRDGFASIDELTAALKLIPARTFLLPVEGAGHELMSKKNAGEFPKKVLATFAEMFRPN